MVPRIGIAPMSPTFQDGATLNSATEGNMAARNGIEPLTSRLTAARSTAELPGNIRWHGGRVLLPTR